MGLENMISQIEVLANQGQNHWQAKVLGSVIDVFDKQRKPLNDSQRLMMKGVYPYCGANGIVDYINDYLFDGEYILLAEDGGYWGSFDNSAYLMRGKFWVNNHAHILSARKETVDNLFLVYLLNYMNIGLFITGTTRGKLTQGTMLNIPIFFPPLPEQRAIAHTLQTVQNTIQVRCKELELERERKAALMQYLFTYGTCDEVLKQTEIGMMPKKWEIVRLGEVFETQLGKMLSQKARTGKSSKPYMRNANVQWGRVECEDVLEMDFDEREKEKFRLQYGDILVCEGGEIGRTAIWRDELAECYFQKAIHRLRPRGNQMLPAFFLHHMERAFRHQNIYGIAGTQTTIAHLPQDKLSAMRIPKPPIDEQREIAQILDACDNKLSALEKEITLHEEFFRTMLEELMTGRLSALPLVE
ncbi:hypothetical protein KDW_31230 [Dictyobacter vulcani]|uniref:Type I restriction modification DNA specificity domain-containing protein n=1 Tax=Dictyobacter vulcani TaxID=2607529 RepID=A0A5J4KRB6_9CHLR|nr:restriction endonuclease subunit S [Dictyobacter vulcani]GER88961.1 hypothetical protein KDW_31230 [Dictyobacter vulcani]